MQILTDLQRDLYCLLERRRDVFSDDILGRIVGGQYFEINFFRWRGRCRDALFFQCLH